MAFVKFAPKGEVYAPDGTDEVTFNFPIDKEPQHNIPFKVWRIKGVFVGKIVRNEIAEYDDLVVSVEAKAPKDYTSVYLAHELRDVGDFTEIDVYYLSVAANYLPYGQIQRKGKPNGPKDGGDVVVTVLTKKP